MRAARFASRIVPPRKMHGCKMRTACGALRKCMAGACSRHAQTPADYPSTLFSPPRRSPAPAPENHAPRHALAECTAGCTHLAPVHLSRRNDATRESGCPHSSLQGCVLSLPLRVRAGVHDARIKCPGLPRSASSEREAATSAVPPKCQPHATPDSAVPASPACRSAEKGLLLLPAPRRNSRAFHRLAAGQNFSLEVRAAFANHDLGQMRQRCEVRRGATEPCEGITGCTLLFSIWQSVSTMRGRTPLKPFRDRIRAQQHHRTRFRFAKRRSHPASVAERNPGSPAVAVPAPPKCAPKQVFRNLC